MLKRMNKKGAEETNWLMLAIIGLVFVLLIILGMWYVKKIASDVTGNVPDNAEIVAQGCSLAIGGELVNAYCFQFREIEFGSKKVYATCDYVKKNYGVVFDSEGITCVTSNIEKDKLDLEKAILQKCLALKSDNLVNGKICKDVATLDKVKSLCTIEGQKLDYFNGDKKVEGICQGSGTTFTLNPPITTP